MSDLTKAFLELVRLASTDLSPDVEKSLTDARDREAAGSAAKSALEAVIQNVKLAREQSTPICQDTGTPIFYVHHPAGWSTKALREQIRSAVAEATSLAYLRPNAVDSISGVNSGNNLGDDAFPTIHFTEIEGEALIVDLMLKGGGCENVGAQYSLPDRRLAAGRDMEGVRKVVLDAVWKAQGKGCAPGVLGGPVAGNPGPPIMDRRRPFFAHSTNPTRTQI
jgi:fumarate hydratase class I